MDQSSSHVEQDQTCWVSELGPWGSGWGSRAASQATPAKPRGFSRQRKSLAACGRAAVERLCRNYRWRARGRAGRGSGPCSELTSGCGWLEAALTGSGMGTGRWALLFFHSPHPLPVSKNWRCIPGKRSWGVTISSEPPVSTSAAAARCKVPPCSPGAGAGLGCAPWRRLPWLSVPRGALVSKWRSFRLWLQLVRGGNGAGFAVFIRSDTLLPAVPGAALFVGLVWPQRWVPRAPGRCG